MLSLKSQSSISLDLGAPNRGYRTSLMVPWLWLFMIGKDSAPSGTASWSVRVLNPMFRICCRLNNFHVYTFYHNPGHDSSLYDCLLDSKARVQSVDDNSVFVFVGDVNAHHSE